MNNAASDLDFNIEQARDRAAESDLRLVRAKGHIFVCQTIHGTLDLSYNHETRVYTLMVSGTYSQQPRQLAEGTKAAVKAALRSAYSVG